MNSMDRVVVIATINSTGIFVQVNTNPTMIAARMIARAAGPRAMAVSQQQRGILTWLTNYPDTVRGWLLG